MEPNKNEFESEYEFYKAQYGALISKQDAEWKSKYEALKAQSTKLADSADSFAKISEWGINEIAKKYDELKAENERLIKRAENLLSALHSIEHAPVPANEREYISWVITAKNMAGGAVSEWTAANFLSTYSNKEVDNG